jgi:hypothetical protein
MSFCHADHEIHSCLGRKNLLDFVKPLTIFIRQGRSWWDKISGPCADGPWGFRLIGML